MPIPDHIHIDILDSELGSRGLRDWDIQIQSRSELGAHGLVTDKSYESRSRKAEKFHGMLLIVSRIAAIQNMPKLPKMMIDSWAGKKTNEITRKLLNLCDISIEDIRTIPAITLKVRLETLVGPSGLVCDIGTSSQEASKNRQKASDRDGLKWIKCKIVSGTTPCAHKSSGSNLVEVFSSHVFTTHFGINPFSCDCGVEFSRDYKLKKHHNRNICGFAPQM